MSARIGRIGFDTAPETAMLGSNVPTHSKGCLDDVYLYYGHH